MVYAPNALHISGLNNYWKPVSKMIELSNLKVSIFNRNGELIFNFTNPYGFWDGTVLETGKIAPNGFYVFLIEIKNNSDQSFIKKGSITLLN